MCSRLLALGAGAASAACGGVEQEKPRKDVNLGRAPIAIGDSPMLLALPEPRRGGLPGQRPRLPPDVRGPGVDPQAPQATDKLPKLVVIALGSNGVDQPRPASTTRSTSSARSGRSAWSPRARPAAAPPATPTSSAARRSKHKNRIVLLDWVKYSSGHSSWFQPDGLHLTFDGADGVRGPVQETAQGSAEATLI